MSDLSAYLTAAARRAGYDLDAQRSGARRAIADASGLSPTAVGRMLSGKTAPDPYNFPGLAAALRVPVEELLRRVGILPEPSIEERTANDSARYRAFHEAADELDRVADVVEAKVAEHFGVDSGIGSGSAQMVRESAHIVRALAGKDISDGVQSPADESTQPTQADRFSYLGGTIEPAVAYRSPVTNRLYCRACCTYPGMHMSLTSEDLPDGGICDECGTDVLIPQQTGTGEAL